MTISLNWYFFSVPVITLTVDVAIYVTYDGLGKGAIDLNSVIGTLETVNNTLFMVSPNSYTVIGPAVKASLQTDVPKGPYFISAKTGDIFKAFRLYTDHQLAFTEAAISDEKDGFIPLPAVTEVSIFK